MANIKLPIAIFFGLTSLVGFGQSTWTAKATLPSSGAFGWQQRAVFPAGPRTAACGFSIGTNGYVFGGTDMTTNYSELYEYNPGTNSWSKKASMPVNGMREPAAFTIDSVAYVGLGFRSGATSHVKTMYKYSPATNSWTQISSFYQGRRAAAGFSIAGRGYIIGGYEYGSTPDNSLYEYWPTKDSWYKKATMPGTARSYPTCGVVNGIAYVMGGLTTGAVYLNDFYSYNPSTNSWTTLTSFPGTGRTTASCIVNDTIIYFGCGKDNTTHFQDWWAFNTVTKKWTKSLSFPSVKTYSNAFFSINGIGYLAIGANNSTLTDSTYALSVNKTGSERSAACGFAVGNYGYLFGGTNLVVDFSELYQYDPSSDVWVQKASMPLAGMREPSAFTIDSVAYVGLGFRHGASSHLSHMYKYSPATNSWTPIKSFYEGRRAATGFAIDSLGYIFGGFELGYHADNSLYSYSPATNSWTKRATMPGNGRSYPAITVLNGKAYVMGGLLQSASGYLKEFYSYDPVADKWTALPDFPGNARTTSSAFTINGIVYFGCGKDNNAHYADWWGYDPGTNKWTQITDFPSPKTYHNVYFTINNKGYCATGANNNVMMDSTFELSSTTTSVKRISGGKNLLIDQVGTSNTIRVNKLEKGLLTINVYDANGKLIYRYVAADAQNNFELEIPAMATGVYFIEAIQGNNRASRKVIF